MTDRHYVTKFTPAAQRDLRQIPLPEARKILIRLGELQKALDAGDVEGFDLKALQGHPGLTRLRVGDYRVVYELDNGELVVWVLRAGDRRDVYRGM